MKPSGTLMPLVEPQMRRHPGLFAQILDKLRIRDYKIGTNRCEIHCIRHIHSLRSGHIDDTAGAGDVMRPTKVMMYCEAVFEVVIPLTSSQTGISM